MAKVLSKREQLDCLILALEENLDMIRKYRRERDADAERATPASVQHVHNHGMARGAEFAEWLISRTLGAAKKQRERARHGKP